MNNRELEQHVIARMIVDPAALGFAALNRLQPQEFETEEGRTIYKFLIETAESKQGAERLEEIGFTALKMFILPEVPSDQRERYVLFIDECRQYSDNDSFELTYEQWREHMEVERTARGLRESMQQLRTSKDPLLAQTHFLEHFLSDRTDIELEDLDDGFKQRHLARKARIATGKDYFISSGFPTFDAALSGGVRPGECFIIGGDTMAGKSRLATHYGLRAKMMNDRNVLHIVCENTMHQQMGRTEAMYFGLDYRRWQNCDPSIHVDALDDLKIGKARHKTIRLLPGEYGITETLLLLRWIKISYDFDPDVIIIDSPDLLDAERGLPEYAKAKYNYLIRHMYRMLSRYIQSHLKILISTSQLNRMRISERRNKGLPELADLSDSIDKERIADYVGIAFQNEHMKEARVHGIRMVKIRDHNTQPFVFMVRTKPHTLRYVEVQIDGAGGMQELDTWDPNMAVQPNELPSGDHADEIVL